MHDSSRKRSAVAGFALTVLVAGLLSLRALPGAAAEADAKAAANYLETGALAEGDKALAAIVDASPENDDARFGLAMIRFVHAVEHLSQNLYRYGLQPPHAMMMPILRLPVPVNEHPEAITYDDFRKILADFNDDLSWTQATLDSMGESPNVKVTVDLTKIRYDANGDGKADDDELFMGVMAKVLGMDTTDVPASFVVAFDRGDAYWLQGYCHVLMAFTEFLLAYDWHENFDDSFHLFFPRADSAFTKALAPPGADLFGEGAPFADAISFIHIPWQLGEPERMSAVRDHLKSMIELSRKSWAAISAETDDDHEWLPNPKQTASVTDMKITAEQLAAWMKVLDTADAVLDGKKLIPHWRFRQGINLAQVFLNPGNFDLVLWVTGPAALPYLQDGDVLTSDQWNELTKAFEGSFGTYAIWIN